MQKPTSLSCLFDRELENFLQDSTPAPYADNGEFQISQTSATTVYTLNGRSNTVKTSAVSTSDYHSEFSSQICVPPPCPADIESTSSVRKPTLNTCSADEKVKSSSHQPFANVNCKSANLLCERARMMNDSDLKSNEAWRGLINENSCFVDVNELSPENPDESNLQDTSQILSELLDLKNSNSENILQNSFCIESNNNNVHSFFTYEQDKLFTKNGSTLSAELQARKPIFSSTPLIDHDYTKIWSEDEKVSTEFPKSNNKDLNPKCDENKPTKVGFYFQTYPQIRFLNERLDNGRKRGFLLKNGLKLGIIKVGNIAVNLQKTCGFDAIIHVLQFGALYDSQYHLAIQLSNNRALKFVCKFMKMGPTIDILRERIVLLNEFYPLVKDPEATSIKPYRLNAEDSITVIWKNLFCCSEPTEPSAIKSSQCSNQECISSLPTDIAYFEVNIRMINTKGIQALQDAVLFHEHCFNIKCRQRNCLGKVTETTRPHFHIFIDLDTRTHRMKTFGLKCHLADIPVMLNFVKEYRYVFLYVCA